MSPKLNNQNFIPVCEPTLSDLETNNVMDAVKSGWISSSGEYVTRFEQEFSTKVGAKHGISCCNGTVALHLALKALGIKEGDEVILPSFTMIATAVAVHYCGAKPIFVDVCDDSWTIHEDSLANAITDKTKAILTTTIYGHPCNYAVIQELCQTNNLLWIEDAAEGHGALFNGRPLAEFADATCYSFYANKIITTGEGGMVCVNNEELADQCRLLRNLASPLTGERGYVHQDIGFNYRFTNLQAAVGVAQLERFDELVEMRRDNAAKYSKRLAEASDLLQLPVEKSWAKNCYWMYGVVLKDNSPTTSDELAVKLKNQGIGTRPFFYPMHKQPSFKTQQSLPVSEYLAQNGILLPSSSHLTTENIDYVCDQLLSSLSYKNTSV